MSYIIKKKKHIFLLSVFVVALTVVGYFVYSNLASANRGCAPTCSWEPYFNSASTLQAQADTRVDLKFNISAGGVVTAPQQNCTIINPAQLQQTSWTGSGGPLIPGMTIYVHVALQTPGSAGTCTPIYSFGTENVYIDNSVYFDTSGLANGTYTVTLSATGSPTNLTTNKNVTVYVQHPSKTLTVNSSGKTGIAISSSTGQGGTTNYSKSVSAGTNVNLVAPLTSGTYAFSSWTGCSSTGGSGGSTCTRNMDANRTVTANYVQTTYNLTVNSSGTTGVVISSSNGYGGTTNYTKSGITSGTNANMTAPATSGAYVFSSWTGCSSVSGNTCTRNMDANRTVTANYVLPTYTLTVKSSGTTGAAITSSTGHGGTTNYTKAGITSGTNVNLVAPSSVGSYNFASWIGCSSINGTTCTRNMDSDRTVTANYTSSTPEPNYVSQGLGVAPGGLNNGDSVTFNAQIKNIGTANATATSSTRLRLDIGNDGTWDQTFANQSTGALATNTTATVNWNNVWTAVPGTHKFEVCADIANNIVELDETDNCTTAIFNVTNYILPSADLTCY